MSDDKFEIDRDQIVDLLNKMWDTNQDQHDEHRRLEAEVTAAKLEALGLVERLQKQALGVGQVGILIDVAMAALDLRDAVGDTSNAHLKLMNLVGQWEASNDGNRVLQGRRNRRVPPPLRGEAGT